MCQYPCILFQVYFRIPWEDLGYVALTTRRWSVVYLLWAVVLADGSWGINIARASLLNNDLWQMTVLRIVHRQSHCSVFYTILNLIPVTYCLEWLTDALRLDEIFFFILIISFFSSFISVLVLFRQGKSLTQCLTELYARMWSQDCDVMWFLW